MHLDGPLGSEKVSPQTHPPLRACGDAADLTWSAAAGQARIELEPIADDAANVRVTGELDVASAGLLEQAVQQAHAAGRYEVRLDLSAVSFCDCAGLSAFIASDRLLRAAGGRLTLRHLSAPVRRLLILTKMHRVLALDRPLDE